MGSGTRNKKSKKTNWGSYYRSDYEYQAMVWCLKNDIRIGLLAAETGNGPKHFYVEIEIGKKKSRDPSKYLAEAARKQVYKYYIYYYEKHRNPVQGTSRGTTKGSFQI
jgi:hypothetical protein